ncbi:mitogen-activated protein kinase binding protein 1 [Bulinus truncatus]|nr:mitogen-activated protein kinase binding protein 1 [Bulinus truncatus]
MNLDLVLGMTCNNISCLACDRNSSLVAHAAAGVLVILDAETNSQVKYLHLRKNCVSSVNFSSDGKLIVTGEIGYRPAARVWRVKVAALYGHDFGIKYVLFSPAMDVIVTVGLEHDNEVNVWAWPEKHRLATNKIVDIIRAVAFSECGKFFVTAGCRHLKFWYPNFLDADVCQTPVPHVQPLYGRPGILGSNKHHNFIDVTCGNGVSNGLIYAITKTGDLIIVAFGSTTCPSILPADATESGRYLHDGVQPKQNLADDGVQELVHVHLGTSTISTTSNKSKLTASALGGGGAAIGVRRGYVAVYHSKAIANIDIFMSNDVGRARPRDPGHRVARLQPMHLWGIQISTSSATTG